MNMLILAGVLVVLVVITFFAVLSRYQRCASDELLVVFGKAGKKVVKDENGKSKTIPTHSKIIHGGGTFVWPIIQDYKRMSLKPIQLQVEASGVSNQMIKVTVPVTLTTAIGTKEELKQNAASRFLSANMNEIRTQITEILIGEMRSLMATMSIEEINSDREAFIGNAKRNIETELNKIGFEIININTSDIDDDADYIRNLGQKAATKARAQAKADIAEEQKKGDIQIANTTKEREIQVAAAEKERATVVAQTKQEQEVAVAEINQEKEIRLAEAKKNQQSGVATQEAEQAANVAKANAEAESAEAAASALKTANVAKSKAEADSKKAQSEAEAEASIAKSKAEADSKKAEAEAFKQTRIAQARQKQEADTQKARNEQEAATAQYEADKRIKSAEAAKQAGVAEQNATIEVSKAKGEAAKAAADADKVAGVSKVEARMAVAKTEQERQIEVNEAVALAAEARLQAEVIVPAQKEKEKVTIEAEAVKQKAILEAEAEAAKIIKKAEAEAEGTKKIMEAEAEGNKKKLLAEAEGKRASLMAEADKVTAIEMAPALAVEKMIASGLTPQHVVQFKTVDQLKAIADAQAQMYEHIHLGQVTVYGNENTAGNFMAKTAEQLNPAFELLKSVPFAKNLKELFGKEDTKQLTTDDSEAHPTNFEETK